MPRSAGCAKRNPRLGATSSPNWPSQKPSNKSVVRHDDHGLGRASSAVRRSPRGGLTGGHRPRPRRSRERVPLHAGDGRAALRSGGMLRGREAPGLGDRVPPGASPAPARRRSVGAGDGLERGASGLVPPHSPRSARAGDVGVDAHTPHCRARCQVDEDAPRCGYVLAAAAITQQVGSHSGHCRLFVRCQARHVQATAAIGTTVLRRWQSVRVRTSTLAESPDTRGDTTQKPAPSMGAEQDM